MPNIIMEGTDASWNTWNEYIGKVELYAGENTNSIKCITENDNSGCINLDKLSVWKYSADPVVDALAFESDNYRISVGGTSALKVNEINSNGVITEKTPYGVNYQSSDTSVATINASGVVTGIKEGTATITANSNGNEGITNITVLTSPILVADCSQIQREVDASMFGYILTPNYDVPDSRLSLLGPILNRETIPAQKQNALEPGKTYYWRVTAYDKQIPSTDKNSPIYDEEQKKDGIECTNGTYSFTTENVPCSPLLYAEQPGDDGTVQLWFRSSNKADSYNIYYGKESRKYTKRILGVKNSTYTIRGLKGSQTYYFAIKAVNSNGESAIWNERSVAASGNGMGWKESDEEGENILLPTQSPTPMPTTKPTSQPTAKPSTSPIVKAPAKVAVRKVESTKKRTLKITWKKNGAVGYQIMIARDAKMTKGKKTYLVSSKKTSKIIKKLNRKKRYYVKIRGYNKLSSKKLYGTWSTKKSVKIK